MGQPLTEYRDALSDLFAKTGGASRYGLERTEEVLETLGNPQRSFRAIHVAGTNGKGSVVAAIDAILRSRGLRVGRFTSPHLVDFRERIVVDGVPVDEETVTRFLAEGDPVFARLGATFFEITTALAFDWFARRQVDVAVLETGLGGRLDATNVITPIAATVVSVALDHTALLGSSIPEIAAEKAGIFKPGVPAIIGELSTDTASLLAASATAVGAKPVVIAANEVGVTNVRVSREGTTFQLKSGGELTDIRTPLAGAHQAWNTAVAWLTLRECGGDLAIEAGEFTSALSRLVLPGRFQRRENIIFDVAHNPEGARVLAETIQMVRPPHQRTALMAVMSDKDWRGMIDALSPAVDRFFFTTAPGAPEDRVWNPAEAHAYALSRGLAADLDLNFADALVRAEKRCGTLVITGSFHTVGAAMSRLQVSADSP